MVITPGARERPQAACDEHPHDDPRLDYVGDREDMAYAQLGQHPPRRATETSPKRSSGTLSCLSERPPDLANLTAAQPVVACVRPSIAPFLYSKRAADPRGRVMGDRSFCPVIVRQRQRNARPKPQTTIVKPADINLHSTGDTTPTIGDTPQRST